MAQLRQITMKVSKIIVSGKRKIDFIEVDLPRIREKQVLVKGIVSGISHGTELAVINQTTPTFRKHWNDDLRCFSNEFPTKTYPCSLGYEYVGEIVEVGKNVHDLAEGDIVWLDAPHQTYNILDMGKTTPYLKLNGKQDINKAVFLALTRVALAGVHDAKPKIGDHAFVSGMGVIGLITIQLLKMSGVNQIFVSDLFELRRNKAKKLATTVFDPERHDVGVLIKNITQRGVDIAIECSGSAKALQDAIKACGVGGKVITVATYREGASQLFLGEEWHRNRIIMLSSMSVNGCPHRDYPLWNIKRLNGTALNLLQKKTIEVESLITQTFDFDEAVKAYALIQKNPEQTIKVLLKY